MKHKKKVFLFLKFDLETSGNITNHPLNAYTGITYIYNKRFAVKTIHHQHSSITIELILTASQY